MVEYGRYAEVRLESDYDTFDGIRGKDVSVDIPKDLLVGEPNVIKAKMIPTKNVRQHFLTLLLCNSVEFFSCLCSNKDEKLRDRLIVLQTYFW